MPDRIPAIREIIRPGRSHPAPYSRGGQYNPIAGNATISARRAVHVVQPRCKFCISPKCKTHVASWPDLARALEKAMTVKYLRNHPLIEGLESRTLLSSSFLSGSVIPRLPTTPQVNASTVPSNGDVNPYGVAIVPHGFAKGGATAPGDILVSNFNNSGNIQGTGTTIVSISPTGHQTLFFQ